MSIYTKIVLLNIIAKQWNVFKFTEKQRMKEDAQRPSSVIVGQRGNYANCSASWTPSTDSEQKQSGVLYLDLTNVFRQASFIKPLMAEQRRHVSCFGDGRN